MKKYIGPAIALFFYLGVGFTFQYMADGLTYGGLPIDFRLKVLFFWPLMLLQLF